MMTYVRPNYHDNEIPLRYTLNKLKIKSTQSTQQNVLRRRIDDEPVSCFIDFMQ